MKKLFVLLNIIIVSAVVLLLGTPSVFAEETWTSVDLTTRFADEALEDYDTTRDSSSGWSYVYTDVYNYRIKTKRVQLGVDKITEVKVPRFFMNGTNAGTYALNQIEIPAFSAVYLRFYHTPDSSTAFNTIVLHGAADDFTRLPNNTPIEVNPLSYVEIEWYLNFEFAQAIEFGLSDAPGTPVDLGVSWTWADTHKKALDSIFYPLRGSFRSDIMSYRYPNPNQSIFDSRAGEDAYFDPDANFPVSYYKSSIKGEALRDVSEYSEVSDLPTTSGNIYSNVNGMGTAEVIDVIDHTIILEIKYLTNTWHLQYEFDEDTDMEMFNEAESRLGHYYTYQGLKYVILNLDDGSMFTVTSQTAANQKFVPYVIWNLDYNEFYKIDRINAYVTVYQEAAHNVYAYFYVDQLVIDNLISATISMQWRYINIFNFASDWYPYAKTLNQAETGGSGVSWEVAAATISTAGIAVSSLLPPPANVIGMGIFAVGTVYFQIQMWENIAAGEHIWSGPVNEIQEATNVDPQKLAQINQRYLQQNPNFTGMTEDYKLWKLFLGQFNKPLEDHIEVKENSFKVIQFTYRTNGQLYTIQEDSINTIFDPGDLDLDPANPPNEGFDLNLLIAGGVGIGVAILIVAGASSNGVFFKNKRFNFGGLISTIIGGLLAGGLLGLLVYFGMSYFL